jgi:hypothetical protein
MKRFQSIICASLLTLAISSTAFAGNIGGMKANSAGNIAGLSTGNIGGLSAGNIGGLSNSGTRQTFSGPRARVDIDTGFDFAGYFFMFFSSLVY